MTATTRSAPPPPLAPGARPAPGYEVLGHLVRTGWLDLYDAWSAERACRCVVKVLRPDRRGEGDLAERLLREGRWLCGFTHPHLVRGYETFDAPEPVVVLETLTGETLAHLVHRLRRRPAATDVALLGVQLCSAVHYLHGQGLLHLDLKPSNVVVDRGRAKLLDLGLAQPPGPVPPGVGTFSYLAPEQARGDSVTTAVDVWGIGVTLYETATGDVPFDRDTGQGEGQSPGAGRDQDRDRSQDLDPRYPQLEAVAPPVSARRRLPPPLAAAVDGCLRPDPADRPTVARLAAALAALLPGHLPGTG